MTNNDTILIAATKLVANDLRDMLAKGMGPKPSGLEESVDILSRALDSIHGPSVNPELLHTAGVLRDIALIHIDTWNLKHA